MFETLTVFPFRRILVSTLLLGGLTLSFGAAAQVQPISPFTILEFPLAPDPAVVYLEHLTGSLFLENEDEVRRYTVMFDHLRAEALGTGQSIDLIAQVAKGFS